MKPTRLTLPIEGLGCGGGGALTVERELVKVPGVAHAYVNPLTEMAYVEYDPDLVDTAQLVAAVRRVGFRASPLETTDRRGLQRET